MSTGALIAWALVCFGIGYIVGRVHELTWWNRILRPTLDTICRECGKPREHRIHGPGSDEHAFR